MTKIAHNRLDLTGQQFGRLTVIKYLYTDKNRKAVWLCQCACGQQTKVLAGKLRNGHTSSCGCWAREVTAPFLRARREENYKHGGCGTPTYKSWDSAKQRCFNPNDDHYPSYGGRGVTMCDRWRYSFQNFLDDMGERPKGTTIDRWPDPLGNYEPGNCRWATPTQQSQNRPSNRYCAMGPGGLPLKEVVKRWGRAPYPTVLARLRNGWDEEDAITTPVGHKPAPIIVPF